MNLSKTGEKIMTAAIMLFSDRGYDLVSMRDIAAEVGIKAASIYNHFPSKKHILKSIYDYYAYQFRIVFPKTDEMLRILETGSIDDVFKNMSYHYEPEIQKNMDRIIRIASHRACMDKDSEIFLSEQFFEPLEEIWNAVLERGIELGKINPIDIYSFIKVISYYAFSAAELTRTDMRVSRKQWNKGLDLLYSQLKPDKI